MIKLPYYFVKKSLWYFYLLNISSSHLSVLEAFQVPPSSVYKIFRSPPQITPPPPLVIYQRSLIKQDIPEKTIVTVWDFRNAKQQVESMSEQSVSGERFIAVFQIMQKSDFRDK